MILNETPTERTKAKDLYTTFFLHVHGDLDSPLQLMFRIKKCVIFMDCLVNLLKSVSVLVSCGRSF